ncbi:hypothetical protein HMPREF3113_11290 [Stenotrophomonas sp. HMSC10F06]|nr:hypothetical protein HMPREF3113_11290 [Stenotrophomonas sp. HMSC10F06]
MGIEGFDDPLYGYSRREELPLPSSHLVRHEDLVEFTEWILLLAFKVEARQYLVHLMDGAGVQQQLFIALKDSLPHGSHLAEGFPVRRSAFLRR